MSGRKPTAATLAEQAGGVVRLLNMGGAEAVQAEALIEALDLCASLERARAGRGHHFGWWIVSGWFREGIFPVQRWTLFQLDGLTTGADFFSSPALGFARVGWRLAPHSAHDAGLFNEVGGLLTEVDRSVNNRNMGEDLLLSPRFRDRTNALTARIRGR